MTCFGARVLIALLLLEFLTPIAAFSEESAYRPEAGKFPAVAEAKSYRGELVFVDHINRRGSLRLHVDGHFGESKPHHFAMLPYGMVRYRGAPADLRDIPLGTVMYGRFYLPPNPKTSSVPNRNKATVTQPVETYAILLEDDASLCLREGKAWKLNDVVLQKQEGTIAVSLDRKDGGEGLGGEHKMTIDRSTRIWRGREQLSLEDLTANGEWLENGNKKMDGRDVYLNLTWHPRYLYQQFHVADLWLDKAAMQQATKQQNALHNRFVRLRWMPAWIDTVDYGESGHATVTATLFGGVDPALYDDFKKGIQGQVAAAEDTLRTYWPDHDGMEGTIVDVRHSAENETLGSSGIQIKFEMDLILEGFRPGRVVRIRPQSWPKVKPPYEECIHDFDDRWPSADIFEK